MTYIGTIRQGGECEKSFAFCRPQCRSSYFTRAMRKFTTYRNDDRYEFDETCANCGVLIPAGEVAP